MQKWCIYYIVQDLEISNEFDRNKLSSTLSMLHRVFCRRPHSRTSSLVKSLNRGTRAMPFLGSTCSSWPVKIPRQRTVAQRNIGAFITVSYSTMDRTRAITYVKKTLQRLQCFTMSKPHCFLLHKQPINYISESLEKLWKQKSTLTLSSEIFCLI